MNNYNECHSLPIQRRQVLYKDRLDTYLHNVYALWSLPARTLGCTVWQRSIGFFALSCDRVGCVKQCFKTY